MIDEDYPHCLSRPGKCKECDEKVRKLVDAARDEGVRSALSAGSALHLASANAEKIREDTRERIVTFLSGASGSGDGPYWSSLIRRLKLSGPI